MDVTDVNLDLTEMVLKLGKGSESQTVEYGRIDKVVFSSKRVKKWFRQVPVKQAEIYVRGKDEPFVVTSLSMKKFDSFQDYFTQVANKNRIDIIMNT